MVILYQVVEDHSHVPTPALVAAEDSPVSIQANTWKLTVMMYDGKSKVVPSDSSLCLARMWYAKEEGGGEGDNLKSEISSGVAWALQLPLWSWLASYVIARDRSSMYCDKCSLSSWTAAVLYNLV